MTMKKIFSVLVFLTTAICVLAKDLTKEQMAVRLDIVKHLSSEGFQPKIDTDGDVKFVKDNINYYIIINDNWSEPFLLTLCKETPYNKEGVITKENVESCISIIAKYKTVKLYCYDNVYSFRTDIFCENANVFKSSFYRIVQEFDAAQQTLTKTLDSGLGGMDITGNKESVFVKAMEFYRQDNYEKSFPLFKMLVDNNYAKAYGYMGLAYELGEGTNVDNELMVRYYEKAIESGYNWCAYRLGNYFYKKEDYSKAMSNYLKCGTNENGFRSDALYQAGLMYEKGEGVERDITQAILCYRKSVQCATELECDARKALIKLKVIVDNKDDFVDATKTMLMGMSKKEMYETGYEYEQGLGNRFVSLPKAYAYFKAAADKGYTKALVKMGEIYVNKYYPFNDKAKSDKYYKKAFKVYKEVEKRDGEACCELGIMYQYGYGVEADKENAKYYYKSGAMLNDKNASWRFGLMCKDELDYRESFDYFMKAAQAGQGMAMYELAKQYEEGLGTPQNRERAIEWYTKCANSNYSARNDARKALKRLGAIEEKD